MLFVMYSKSYDKTMRNLFSSRINNTGRSTRVGVVANHGIALRCALNYILHMTTKPEHSFSYQLSLPLRQANVLVSQSSPSSL